MEVTEKAIVNNRLKILYLLKNANTRLSDGQLLSVSADLSLMDAIDLNLVLADMSESGLLLRHESVNGIFYTVSDAGVSTLGFFVKEINMSTRQKIDKYLAENGEELALEARLFASYIRVAEDEYRLNMRMMENENTAFEITMITATKEEAAKMAQGWKKNSMDVYRAVCEELYK